MATSATTLVGLPPYLIGIGMSRGMSLRDDHNTADGGRPARIDYLMDSDRAAGGALPNQEERMAASRKRKVFCVTEATRQGGSGLYGYRTEKE